MIRYRDPLAYLPPAAVVTQSQEEEKFLVFYFGSFSQLDILNPVWIDVAYFHLVQDIWVLKVETP